MQNRNSNNLKGIDVSHWDGDIDFSKVKNDGYKIVYIKATQGENSIDSFFKINAEKAKKNNLLIGFYHYFTATSESSAKKEAQHFVNTTKPYPCDCKMALDVEVNNGLSSSQLTNLSKIFLDEVKRLSGIDVVVYTYTSFAKENLQKSIGNYPVWIAHYGVSTPGNNGIWDTWAGFQYSEKGLVSGINADVDLNEFTESILLKYKPIEKPQSPSTPVIKPETTMTYKVKSGDTLGKIAVKYSITVEKLVKLNNIKNPNLIKVGEILKIK